MQEVQTDVAEDLKPVGEGEEFEPYDAPEGTRTKPEETEADLEDTGEQTRPRRTLAELAADEPEADDGPEDDGEPQQMLFGTESKITGSVKGRKPDQSAVKMKSGAVTVNGQFHPDDMLELRVLARLDKVEFVYLRDKDNAIKGSKRIHHATPVTIEQVEVPAEVAEARVAKAAELLDVEPSELASALERAAAEVAAEYTGK